MNRSLGKASANSLELLLDTICNMFGSIILITLLIVIVTSEKPIDQILDMGQGPDREEIERRIETARFQITSLQSEIQKESEKAPSASEKGELVSDLETKVREAKSALQQALLAQQIAFDRTSPDFAKTLREFKTRLETLSIEITDLENQLADTQRRHPALQAELATLQAAHKKLVSKQVEKLRLPKVRSTSKKPSIVFCAHGQIYPIYIYGQSGESELFNGLKNEDLNEGQVEYFPQIGQGISADPLSIQRSFAHLPADRYLSVYIYPDSVEAFRELRKALSGSNIDIGWDPLEPGERLIFVPAGGGIPAPQPQ